MNPDNIGLVILEPHKRTGYSRPMFVVISEFYLKVSVWLSIYPFFHLVLCSYGLATTHLNLNSQSQMVGLWILRLEAVLGKDMPISVFHSIYNPKAMGGGKSFYSVMSWGPILPF